MARLLASADDEGYTELFELEMDRAISSGAMRVYLRYRLYLIENQIKALHRRLKVMDQVSGGLWTWMDKPRAEEKWASWTSLNYLMNARDALRKGLEPRQ